MLPVTPASTLWRGLRDEVRQHYRRGRILLGVDGADGAGKTMFADNLAAVFAEDGSVVFRASVDGFHRPRSARYARGRASAEGFYRDSYDYATFRRVLIDPFRGEATVEAGFQLAAFDVDRDEPVGSEWVTAPRDAVLIVDGIFLHRPELRDIWHWSVWLDAPLEVRYARMAERDGTAADPAAASNRRYREGMELYLREANPRAAASAVVDNTDPSRPLRV